MGYVMDELNIRDRAKTKMTFEAALRPLGGRTHWASGEGIFGTERRRWNALQKQITGSSRTVSSGWSADAEHKEIP